MIRNTQQRKAIYNALGKSGRPLSVNEILVIAQNEINTLGIATVYRNLKTLQEEGRINQVDLPGQAPRWEVPASHHHHFLCRSCDKVFVINACPENIRQLLPEGYDLEDAYILLHGQCNDCARKAQTNTNRDTQHLEK